MRSFGLFFALACVLGPVFAPSRQADYGGPTWAKDIAPMIHGRCSPCHSEGGHGPFPLLSYRDVARRTELVRQEILSMAMPPCSATSDFGEFCTEPPLDDAQRLVFQRWLQAGAPEGETSSAPTIKHGWRLGRPDLVLQPLAVPVVPHEGNPVWRAIVIDPKNTKPLHLRAFDVLPHAPQTLRHVLLAVLAKGEERTQWTTFGTLDESASRLIGSWAPGYRAWRLPKGVSMTVQPGEKLVAQVLLYPSGKVEEPQIDLGLYLSSGRGDKEARWIDMEVKEFSLKAYDERTLTNGLVLDRAVDMISVLPEARFFAYSVNVHAETKDGAKKVLFRTDKWSPYWVGNYLLPKPVRLASGTSVISDTAYENQLHSPINEGRTPRQVWSGPGLDQEVCRTHLLVVDR